MRSTGGAPCGRQERRARGDRGTALIESAFIFPVVIIILFGIVEVGYLYRTASLVTGSTRAGARIASAQYGSAYSGSNSDAQNQAAERVVADSAAGAVTAELLSDGVTDTPQLLWIFKADSNGNTCDSSTVGTPCKPSPSGLGSCAIDCFRYTWDAGTKSWSYDAGSPGWLTPDACGQVVDYLGVYVNLDHQAVVSPQALPINTLTKKTVMRLEARDTCTSPEGPN